MIAVVFSVALIALVVLLCVIEWRRTGYLDIPAFEPDADPVLR